MDTPDASAVTDVRLSDGAFALEIVRRPLRVEGGRIVAGDPVTETIDLAARRLRLALTERASVGEGCVLLARLHNYGVGPVAVACVALVRPGTMGAGERGRTLYVFGPDRGANGKGDVPGWPVMPGETRGFVLGHDSRERAIRDLRPRDPATYYLGAFADRRCEEEDEQCRLTGGEFAPLVG